MSKKKHVSVEDKDAIRELTARYSFAIGDGDPDGVAACFTEEGVFNGRERRLVGRDQIRQLGHDRTATRLPRYIVTNFLITARSGEEDACDVRTELLSYVYTPSGVNFLTSGFYEDIVVKIDGEWYFRQRTVKADIFV